MFICAVNSAILHSFHELYIMLLVVLKKYISVTLQVVVNNMCMYFAGYCKFVINIYLVPVMQVGTYD
jgi:hypothetical protein